MAGHVFSAQVIEECYVVEEELLAKVAVWMWQYLPMFVVAEIALLDVLTKLIYMIEPLLSNEYSSSLETNFTKSFLVASFEMALQWSTIRKLLFCARTIRNETIKGSQLQRCLLCRIVVIVYGIILRVFLTLFFELLVEEFPCESFVVRNDYFVQICAANWTFFILED